MTELQTRAYAALEVKAVGDDRRTFSGWATTPSLDRVSDTIAPLGVRFKNPITLLHGHKHDMPIGTAIFRKPTSKGVEFDAEIPEISEDYPALRERLNTAYGELKYGLVRAVSIGFRALKYAFNEVGGIDYQEIEVYELSIVAIPALPDAIVTSVKGMYPALSSDMVQQIKRFDTGAPVRNGPVRLIMPKKATPEKLPGGAVRLNTVSQ